MGNHKRKERHWPKKKVSINQQKNEAYPLTKCFHIHEPHFILVIYYKLYIIRLLRNHYQEYLNIKVLIFQLPLSAMLTVPTHHSRLSWEDPAFLRIFFFQSSFRFAGKLHRKNRVPLFPTVSFIINILH